VFALVNSVSHHRRCVSGYALAINVLVATRGVLGASSPLPTQPRRTLADDISTGVTPRRYRHHRTIRNCDATLGPRLVATSVQGRAWMYLRELFIKNSGPLQELQIEFAFTAEDRPIPHLIVGRNGTGKTNLLSLIADAVMEGAADVYNDVLTSAGIGRNWFRIVGGKTTRYNESGSFSILRFEHDGHQLFYRENAGQITAAEAQAIIPPTLKDAANWPDSGKDGKAFNINEDTVRSIYERGAHAFFPSSRSEIPFWLNQKSLFEDTYDATERFRQSLGKPIYVEHGTDLFAQWLLGVLTESRARLVPVLDASNPGQASLNIGDAAAFANATNTLGFANQILRAIMDDSQAQFFWAGRRQPRKVAVLSGNQVLAAGLDGLSGGQSSLLAMFGTILRYGDAAGLGPQDLPGVVVIDELDAHMHIDLQMKAVPKLIAMFPRIQFVISSHSPIFLLGMEKQFPDGGIKILEMPRGNPLTAEAYDEFTKAWEVLQDTEAFESTISGVLSASEKPIVWFEGELDECYFKRAARLLGYDDLVDTFHWIGALGNKGGPFNTGDTALNHALSLLKANPEFSRRKIVLVYDCDTKKPSETIETITVIGLRPVPDRRVQKGVENLLRPSAIPGELYNSKTYVSDYGETTQSEKLDKPALCELLCSENADVENFRDFQPVLAEIRLALSDATGETEPTDQSEAADSVDDETAK
jgi:hypothetical protein